MQFGYREHGRDNPSTLIVFLVHLAAVLDNWDPRVVNGFAAKHRVGRARSIEPLHLNNKTPQPGQPNMKALIFNRYGKRDNVTFADRPRPVPKPDEILVQVQAVGLNPIDNMIARGTFKPILRFQLPATLGSDLAGVVVEVGSRVTRFKPGDSVFASIFDLGTGALAEFARVPENAAALKPAKLDFVQAASIPMVGLTSWQALKERAHLKPGQKVFIPAGSGGIGTFAIQLAKVLGASVGTTTSTGNVDLVRSLGADEVVDYKKQKFEDVLRDYDAVLGTVRGDALEKALQILKPQSTVVSLIGPPDAAFARARGMNFVMVGVFGLLSRKIIRQAKKRGVAYSFLFVHPDGSELAEIGALLDAGRIRPVIDKIFPFDQAKEALAYLEQGRAKGKVVVQMK
jgi:NADPH:quinone reductase-like Zn-dependent oxidoreductase